MSEIQPAHARKPDPDEPWRYVCPDCGGQVNGGDSSHGYRCTTCGVRHGPDQLYDRKRGATGVM